MEVSAVEARIFKPARNAMQSGRGGSLDWILEFEPSEAKRLDPLMGWSGSSDTRGQVTLRFATQTEAVAYAKRRGIAFTLPAPHLPKPRPKSYSENFRYRRPD
jgi:hypothetical protein